MARFRHDEVDHYGGNGGAGYFSLKNDKDVARVRFMYNGIDDVEGFAVHEVEVDGKKRYVNCLREYNQPVDSCPFCAARKFQTAKLFVPVYNIDEDRIQIWERGKKFFAKISSICARYSNLVSHVFEIERNGKAGDTQTTYEIYEVSQDETTFEDLPEMPDILGGLVLDKTYEDMNYFLDNDEFPSDDSGSTPRRGNDTPRDDVRPTGRRTPNNTSNRRDRF